MYARINVTPFIDILLVLLVIFMVIQPVTQYELRARVPDKPQKEDRFPETVIVVSIDDENRVAINGSPVSREHLGERLFQILSQRVDRRIFVQGSPDLAYGMVIKIIDVARGAKATEIGLLH